MNQQNMGGQNRPGFPGRGGSVGNQNNRPAGPSYGAPQGTIPNVPGRTQQPVNPGLNNNLQQNPRQGMGQQPGKLPNAPKKKKDSVVGWIFLGLLLMLVLTVAGGFAGYNTAVRSRENEKERQSALAAAEQYQFALADIAEGKNQNALSRLQYVLEVSPDYPGAKEKYMEVQVSLYPKATPTSSFTSTPSPTSTPDTRGEEEMYNTVLSNMYASSWEEAINSINALRDRNIDYRAADLDGMYYVALRYWGIQLINQGYLESGIYKITLAEQLGPIDGTAKSSRDAARSYLAGAGFWEIDWNKALTYYTNAYLSYPQMFDQATKLTAQQRYADASFGVANLYVISEASNTCDSIPYFDQGFLAGSDEVYAITATAVYNECYPPEPVVDQEGDGSDVAEIVDAGGEIVNAE